MSIQDFTNNLVRGLSEEELRVLRVACTLRQWEIEKEKLDNGTIPPIDSSERDLLLKGRNVQAVKTYRDRVIKETSCDFTLSFAKLVIERAMKEYL